MAVGLTYVGSLSTGSSNVSSQTWNFASDLSHTLNTGANVVVVLAVYFLNANNRTVSSITSNSAGYSWYELGFEAVASSGSWHPGGLYLGDASSITSDDFTINVSGGTAKVRCQVWELTSANDDLADWSSWSFQGDHKDTSADFTFGGDLDFSTTGEDDGAGLAVMNASATICNTQDGDWTYRSFTPNGATADVVVSGQPTAFSHDIGLSGSGRQTGFMGIVGAASSGGGGLVLPQNQLSQVRGGGAPHPMSSLDGGLIMNRRRAA